MLLLAESADVVTPADDIGDTEQPHATQTEAHQRRLPPQTHQVRRGRRGESTCISHLVMCETNPNYNETSHL